MTEPKYGKIKHFNEFNVMDLHGKKGEMYVGTDSSLKKGDWSVRQIWFKADDGVMYLIQEDATKS